MPEMLFGRFDHAMTVLDQRYLYVFGGQMLARQYQSQFFERLDLT